MVQLLKIRKWAMFLIAGLFSITSIYYLVTTFQWKQIYLVLLGVKLSWLVLSAASVIIYWLIRSLRWYLLLREVDDSVCFVDLYMYSAIGLAFAIITPLQSGEIIKIELLKKYAKTNRLAGYSSFTVERVLDMIVVSVIALVGLFVGTFIKLDFISGLVAVLMILGFTSIFAVLVWKVNFPITIKKFQIHLKKCVKDFRVLVVVLLLTFLCWGMTAVGWFTCLHSIGVDLGYFRTILMTAIISLLNILSFVPGAVGVSEAGISLFLLHIGLPSSEAQAGALILRFYSVMILIMGVFHLLLCRFRNQS